MILNNNEKEIIQNFLSPEKYEIKDENKKQYFFN